MTGNRMEKDSLGEIEVAGEVYWGAQTERARRNFPVSGLVFQRRFIAALGLIKGECAAVNAEMGIVDRQLAETIQARRRRSPTASTTTSSSSTSSRPAAAPRRT